MMEYLFVDNPSPLSLFVAMLAFFLAVFYFVHNKQALPPGPRGLPYLGFWPFLREKTCHLQLEELTRKYGDVTSFTCMGRLIINLGSIKAVRDAHVTQGDCFGDRVMDFSVFQSMFKNGVFYMNGEPWKVHRKFFLQSMKERGVKAITDTHSGSISEVITSTLKQLEESKGEPVNVTDMLTTKCTTTLRLTLFGEDGLTDQKTREIVSVYEVMVEAMTPTNLLLVGNFAKYFILPFQANYRLADKSTDKMRNILLDIVNQHKTSYNEDHMRDVIDEFIKERNERLKKGDPTAKYFSDETLVSNLVQFVGDGVLGVSFLSNVMIRSLVEYPEEQEKLYEEIIEVVGPDRLPTMDDKPNLPYFNAFMLEVFRVSDLFSLIPGLECSKDTTLRGYKIPKGSITLLNMWACHNDPDMYEEPRKFNPSRFITKDGKKRPELPITFGVGKRACLGEGFALAQIFLFLSAIVKNFKLSAPENTDATQFDLLVHGKMEIYAHSRA